MNDSGEWDKTDNAMAIDRLIDFGELEVAATLRRITAAVRIYTRESVVRACGLFADASRRYLEHNSVLVCVVVGTVRIGLLGFGPVGYGSIDRLHRIGYMRIHKSQDQYRTFWIQS